MIKESRRRNSKAQTSKFSHGFPQKNADIKLQIGADLIRTKNQETGIKTLIEDYTEQRAKVSNDFESEIKNPVLY